MTTDARISLWEDHLRSEMVDRDADAAMSVMSAHPYVNHVPTMTGGSGHAELRRFYRHHFVDVNPKDMEIITVSRTVGENCLVDELVIRFTHSCVIDYFLPGIEPTGRPIEVALVVVARFEDDGLAHEHIYWDQASVLVQIGLLDPKGLPVAGREVARKVLDRSLPSNGLMQKEWARSEGVD